MSKREVVFLGIDWATEKHDGCLVDEDGEILGRIQVDHSAVGLCELMDWARRLGDAMEVKVSIETSHGAVVETLLEHGFAVHSINPKQLDRFRDRFSVSGAKDDRRDARALADALRTDPRAFRLLKCPEAVFIALRQHSRMLEQQREQRQACANRIRQELLRYYPEFLKVSSDVTLPWVIALWEKVPTPEAAKKLRASTAQQLLKKHRVRKISGEQVVETLKASGIKVAEGTVDVICQSIRSLLREAKLYAELCAETEKLMREQLAKCKAAADTKANPEGEKPELRDADILASLPGIGDYVLATMLGEAHAAFEARDHGALRVLAGAAPITKQSGKSKTVSIRRACHNRLRDALYHWSRVSVMHDPKSKASYKALRARGHRHGRALRQVGDRLLGVACAMLRDRTVYDPRHCFPEKSAC
jgi:transposase